jgi:hypothetical protein
MHKVDTNIPKFVLFGVSSNNSHLGEHLLTIGAMQCVDKSCPIRIGNSLFNGKFQFEQPFNH